MAKSLMIQGTASDSGKSFVVAGICRALRNRGIDTAPFKSQNMALNSFVTDEGLEMGRAQVMQAEAAKVRPVSDMNPILLKPTGNMGSQVIINGKSIGNMRAKDYFLNKVKYKEFVKDAYSRLSQQYSAIIIEGAGSPAEINLKKDDIVNMGMAEIADAPVFIVGDIDRGGVFAALYGTYMLLEENEKARVKGFIINKFRGDIELLKPALVKIEELTSVPVVGVIPYENIILDDEDSLSNGVNNRSAVGKDIDIAVVKLPRISNFSDFVPLSLYSNLKYTDDIEFIKNADAVILPGSKNTQGDLRWLVETGITDTIKDCCKNGKPIVGICGGYQMLGEYISDENGAEFEGITDGLGLIPKHTYFSKDKYTRQAEVTLKCADSESLFSFADGLTAKGYEIHMGVTEPNTEKESSSVYNGSLSGYVGKNIFGTYLHGIFDNGDFLKGFIDMLKSRKSTDNNTSEPVADYAAFKESQYEKLGALIEDNLDIDKILSIMGLK